MFQRLRDAGLKLKPAKSDLFEQKVRYLSHVVTPEGISTNPDKIKVVRDWRTQESKGSSQFCRTCVLLQEVYRGVSSGGEAFARAYRKTQGFPVDH